MISILQKSAMAFVTLGVGKIPVAPGTWGSALGLVLWWLLQPYADPALGIIVAVFLAAVPLITIYEKSTGRHDPKEVIIDEVLGIWLTLLAVPMTLSVWGVGFVLFRGFDILKPFPIGWIDRRLPGAWGTLLDDIVAGLLARGCLALLLGWGVL